jgi:uncharacterized protein (DUF433 family)
MHRRQWYANGKVVTHGFVPVASAAIIAAVSADAARDHAFQTGRIDSILLATWANVNPSCSRGLERHRHQSIAGRRRAWYRWIMSIEQRTWKYLAAKPNSHYRQLFVKGTRIAARVLYTYYTPGEDWEGESAQEIASGFNLPLEAVQEAIAYCEADPPEIREDLLREEALMEATGMNDPAYKLHPSPRPLSADDYARFFLQ